MEEFDVRSARGEIKELQEVIERMKICPHCKKKMEWGASSWKEDKYGCYTNKKCPFRKKHSYCYSVDVGFQSSKILRLKKNIEVYNQGVRDGKKKRS